jgi:hypothetical protein
MKGQKWQNKKIERIVFEEGEIKYSNKKARMREKQKLKVVQDKLKAFKWSKTKEENNKEYPEDDRRNAFELITKMDNELKSGENNSKFLILFDKWIYCKMII